MKKIITGGIIALLAVFMIWVGIFMVNKVRTGKIQDYVLVYNSNGKQIKRISTRKDVAYLSNSVGDLGAKQIGIHKKMPVKAKIEYHYAMYQMKPKYKMDMYVYKNSNYLTLKGLPFVSYGNWQMGSRLSSKLHNPDNFR